MTLRFMRRPHLLIFVFAIMFSVCLIFAGCSKPSKTEMAQKELHDLFNPASKDQAESMPSNFSKLREGMTIDEAFKVLGLDTNKQYPTTPQSLGSKTYLNMLIRDNQCLELLIDSNSGKLLAARLGSANWPNSAIWKEVEGP